MIGVFPGKFLPPHRGHITSIIKAACQVEKLYVVVSDSKKHTKYKCDINNLRPMPLKLRAKWLSIELQGMENVEVLLLDESDIPPFPHGWAEWAVLLQGLIPEFDVIFGGEESYKKDHNLHFPNAQYWLIDYSRSRFPISATMIRSDPLKYWDYILGSARPHFCKRIMVTGTESCGKTTMVKALAKIFHTSWAEEGGRYYSERYLGGNENVFTREDFINIAIQQRAIEDHALKSANKIAFFDTDAVVTQYYLGMYLGIHSALIDTLVDRTKYDAVIMLEPTVPWVADGLRWQSSQLTRIANHQRLWAMYVARSFNTAHEFYSITQDRYIDRLTAAIEIADSVLLGG